MLSAAGEVAARVLGPTLKKETDPGGNTESKPNEETAASCTVQLTVPGHKSEVRGLLVILLNV